MSLLYLLVTLCCALSADPITKSDLDQLADLIDGDIEYPDEQTNCLLSDKMTLTAYNCPYQNSSAVILVENADDISITIPFITMFDTEFRIKSGGNSLGGYSKCNNCININLERMTDINYKLGKQIDSHGQLIDDHIYAEIESGCSANKIVQSFTENNYNVRIPHAGSLGVSGGFYQSGGVHQTIKKHGYASDYIIGVEIVLYDGTIKTIFDKDEKKHSHVHKKKCNKKSNNINDLLWAIRGSGGGSFGIITKYYLKTVPLESSDTILIFNIKYIFTQQSGLLVFKAFDNFVKTTNKYYFLTLAIDVGEPSDEQPYGYFFRLHGHYMGDNIHKAKENINNLLLNTNDGAVGQYAVKVEIKYPPNEYNSENFAWFPLDQLPGFTNTRLVKTFSALTDEFYNAVINYYVTNFFVDGSKCICGVGSECSECIPGTNDLLTCCGVGSRTIFDLYGNGVYNADPDNCFTSAPNRDYIGKFTLSTGSISVDIFDSVKDTLLPTILNVGISDVLSHLGNQNFIGYRDGVDTNLDSYFGGKHNKKILKDLIKIKSKYDPEDVFNHPLSIPPKHKKQK
eukprot:203450_1